MSYYLKKLGSNELGMHASGTVARGRHFYVSKNATLFFPPLSEIIKNDTAIIPIVNVMLNPGNEIYCSYVFHNDKFNTEGGTRDEYRLYLNSAIDPDRSFFNVNDIVVFEKRAGGGADTEQEFAYNLYRYKPDDEIYNYLDGLLTSSSIRGGHAITDTIEGLKINENPLTDITIPDEVNTQIQSILPQFDNDEIAAGANLFNTQTFRSFVLHSYNEKCAITGTAIKWKEYNNLDAAHIKPKSHKGPFLPNNGICLSKDMHWAFDNGFFTIDDNYKIKVHNEITNTPLNLYDNKVIFVPRTDFYKPSTKYLGYHRDIIFGKFKRYKID